MKKKLFSCLLGVLLVLSFAACAPEEEPPVTPGFDVEPSTIELDVGETQQIGLTNIVSFEESDFSYVSYDASVASVSDSGLVTAVAEGDTTILVKAGDVRKQIPVTVSDPFKLNNVSYAKLRDIAAIPSGTDGVGINSVGAGGALVNYAWDGGTAESTASKVDFEGTAENTALVARTSSMNSDAASVDNGDYVVILSAQNGDALPSDSAHCMVYYKTTVPALANSFRLWGWASKSDVEASPASGKGRFRVVAYTFDEGYTSYTTTPLVASDLGSLTQDSNGWIAYEDVDDVLNGHIAGAPADNMFVFDVTGEDYDLIGKEIILSVEFMGVDTSMPDRFGIKRLGFMLDDEAAFSLSSSASVELFSGGTSQISVTTQGAATEGTMHYVSSDTTVATVSDSGLITAGEVTEEKTCTISVTNSNVEDVTVTVEVTVKPTPDTSFTVPASMFVANGATASIEITDQVGCEEGFTYQSASDSIATVSADGVITGIMPGVTTVRVSCNGMYHDVKVTVTATSLYGLSLDELKAVGTLGTPGGFPAALDFAWSGLTPEDNVDPDDTTTAKVHVWAKDASALNTLEANDVNLICNIGDQGTSGVQNALFYKQNTPAAANEFRVWIRTAQANNADMCDDIYFRVVAYYLNEDGTAYIPYVMVLNASTDATATTTQDADGIIHMDGGTAVDAFVNFVPSSEILGKEGVIIAVETFSMNGQGVQSRALVRRLGFDQ